MSTRTAAWLGASTVVATVAAAVLAIFGPAVYRYPEPNTLPTGSESIWSFGVPIELAVFLSLMLLGALLVAAAAMQRAKRRPWATALAWAAAILVLAGTIVTLPGESTIVTPAALASDIPDSMGIGAYFVPASIASVVTAIIASVSPAPVRAVA